MGDASNVIGTALLRDSVRLAAHYPSTCVALEHVTAEGVDRDSPVQRNCRSFGVW